MPLQEVTLYNWLYSLLDTNKATLGLNAIYKNSKENIKHALPCAVLVWNGIGAEDPGPDGSMQTPVNLTIELYTRDKSTPQVDIMTLALTIRNYLRTNIYSCTTVSGLWNGSLIFYDIENEDIPSEVNFKVSIPFSVVVEFGALTGT